MSYVFFIYRFRPFPSCRTATVLFRVRLNHVLRDCTLKYIECGLHDRKYEINEEKPVGFYTRKRSIPEFGVFASGGVAILGVWDISSIRDGARYIIDRRAILTLKNNTVRNRQHLIPRPLEDGTTRA